MTETKDRAQGRAIDFRARTMERRCRESVRMAEKKRPGEDSLSNLNTSAEVNEMDYKEGQRRKAGQMSGTESAEKNEKKPVSSDVTSMAESDEDMG